MYFGVLINLLNPCLKPLSVPQMSSKRYSSISSPLSRNNCTHRGTDETRGVELDFVLLVGYDVAVDELLVTSEETRQAGKQRRGALIRDLDGAIHLVGAGTATAVTGVLLSGTILIVGNILEANTARKLPTLSTLSHTAT